jgi:hypothetical protein
MDIFLLLPIQFRGSISEAVNHLSSNYFYRHTGEIFDVILAVGVKIIIFCNLVVR